MTAPIFFTNHQVNARLKNKRKLKSFLKEVGQQFNFKTKRIDYIFCNDSFLLAINKASLQHNEYTDIITFDLSSQKNELEAEIYISVDRVQENAIIFNQSYHQELHRVIFHGILHLVGFKDKRKSDIVVMRQKENQLLASYNTYVSQKTVS